MRRLDEAVITSPLADLAGETVEAIATRGIWSVALHDELADSSLDFMLRDGADRLRIWSPLLRTLGSESVNR